MRFRIFLAFALLFTLATVASAQTKISGTAQCGKPDQQHAIEVGDRPNHSFVIAQAKCTWTKTFEIAGSESKDYVGTNFQEVSGNSATFQGSGFGTMASGDKYFVRLRGKATLKDGALDTAEDTWSFAGGTGKLKGIKGKGTTKGRGAADGSATYEVEGEYELPK